MRSSLLLVVALSAATVASGAEAVRESVARVESVALFKNGLGYFRSTVEIPQGETVIRLGRLPVPAYGTFWVSYPDDLPLRRIVTAMEEESRTVPARSVTELLSLNSGREVTLYLKEGGGDPVQGTLVDLADGPAVRLPNPYFMGDRRTQSTWGGVPATPVVIRTAHGTTAVGIESIARADFSDDEIRTHESVPSRLPAMRIELNRPAKATTVEVSWLAKGMTWAPSYRIDLSDPDTARLEAKALVINEAIDLDGVRVDLVTGYPHTRFGEVRSPVAMQDLLADFLNALAGDATTNRGARSHMRAQASVVSNVAMMDVSAPVPGYSAASAGTTAEDLFLYPVEGVNLAQGETAYIPVFATDLPYRHIYVWKIGDSLDANNQYQARQGETDALYEEVWHACRLGNALDLPLTTAAAEFVKDGQFVGQDVAYYTAPGAETTIRINRAMNVLAEQAEFEVERQRDSTRIMGRSHDLVTVRGELRLRSRMDRPVQVEVTKELSGEVLSMEPSGSDVKTAGGIRQVNPKHRLVWEQELQAGAAMTLTYRYQVYVRN